jgi:hypothetical protein
MVVPVQIVTQICIEPKTPVVVFVMMATLIMESLYVKFAIILVQLVLMDLPVLPVVPSD